MLLEIKNLTMRFGSLVAVDDVCLSVEPNRIYALIGPNGAGKTTLFNMVAGHLVPTMGVIDFNGIRLNGLPTYKVNTAGISRTYQNINLFRSMTVLENILVGFHPRLKSGFVRSILRTKSERAEEKETLRKSIELLEFVGIDSHKDDLSDSLPYGKQRLLEICRAIASSPKLLLLDEPAAGMNPTEKRELVRLIRQICSTMDTTVLIVEHEMNVVMTIAEKIFVLNYGRKIAEGTPEEIQRNPEVITAYLGGDD